MSNATSESADSISIGLEYDGPALSNHEMNVRDLAPTLLGAADLLQDLNRRINPTAADLSVAVRATSQGSFLIDLAVAYAVGKDGPRRADASRAGTLATLVGGLGGLFRHMKSRASVAGPEIPRAVAESCQDVKIQHDVRQLLRPLERDGIDSLTIRQEGTVIVSVDRSDVGDYGIQGDGSTLPLTVNEREQLLAIRTILFSSDTWQFSDGGSVFNAKLQDADFIAQVNRGEPFSKLDLLRCLIREVQTVDEKGLHSSIEVLRVIEHLPRAQ
jgi:hypothetical protein